ncbi:hypothetical protein [Hominilimicola sp.]|uniref:hypothetical protein n=1 Tax=Hominilimicola sp. TaxID=3073571 RepID=UPI0039A053A2
MKDNTLLFEVKGQYIVRLDSIEPVAKCRNLYKAQFQFKTDEWTGTKTALFVQGEYSKSVILDENGTCKIPWEFFDSDNTTFGYVSVYCGDLVTANRVVVDIVKSGYQESDASVPPSPDVYQQLIELAEDTKEIAQSVRDDADNGVFNGEEGYSPKVSLTEELDGVTVTVQNKDGQQSAKVKDGKDYEHSEEFTRLAEQVRQDKESVEQTKTAVDKTAQDFTLTAQQALADVNDAGQTQSERVQQVGQDAIADVNTAKTQAVETVNATKTDAVKAVQTEGTKQAEAVQVKGQEVISSIPGDYTTQMATKLDKQQSVEHAGKALVVGKDGNVVPGEVQNCGMKLLVRYTHKANGSMELSNLDLQTGTFTTSEPHGLKENTALYIKPLAGCYPKHVPIEIFKNNPSQWGRGNIYAHVIDETNFQILSKKDGDILLFTDSTNSEVDVKYFTFEYSMKKITLDNINSRVIDVVANGICSGGYFAINATTNHKSIYSTRTSSNLFSFFSTAQTSGHYQYACRMVYDKGVITSTIPIVAMAVDGKSYVSNNVNKIGRQYVRAVCGMGMESNPNEEKEDGYIKSIQPFSEEVYPFNGAYVEIWGYED